MNIADRIEASPEIMLGKPVIKGTRITVSFILDALVTMSVEEWNGLCRGRTSEIKGPTPIKSVKVVVEKALREDLIEKGKFVSLND